jgi:hypothetical protein
MIQSNDLAAAKDFLAEFHEDWYMQASDPEGIVALFIQEAEDSDQLLSVARGLEALIARPDSNEAMERALYEEFRCNVRPSIRGKTVRQWLSEVVTTLRQAVRSP